MSRTDLLIIKETHRGLLYEDGVFRQLLGAGRHKIPRPSPAWLAWFGIRATRFEFILVDVRGRDRTVLVSDFLIADGGTISASFAVQYRVVDPVAAHHEVKNFEDRLYHETQTAARKILRGLSVEEVLGSRDEIGEEMTIHVQKSASRYGVEIEGLDFKDLVIADELRQVMNRAILSRRLRQDSTLKDSANDSDRDFPLVAIGGRDDEAESVDVAGWIAPTSTFDPSRDQENGRAIDRAPIATQFVDRRAGRAVDSALLRCQP